MTSVHSAKLFLKILGFFFLVLTNHAAQALSLKSPAFGDGGIIPNEFTFSSAGQCSGANASPPLVFDGVPDGTMSFALTVRDPDGGNWLHWKTWNIPATVDAIPQNFSAWTPYSQATNDFGKLGYGGPCPPSGSHRYIFTLYALGVSSLSGEPNDAQLSAAALQTATLTGTRSPASNVSWVSDKIIQKGWWWNPRESGRGFSIEQSSTTKNIFMAAYTYESTGAAMWYVSNLIRSTTSASPLHQGNMMSFVNGQSLQGAYRAPNQINYSNVVFIHTIDSDRALLTITNPDGNSPLVILALRRFEYFSGSLSAPLPANTPESGWWWNPQESGKGYFIEIQKSGAFLAVYTYNVNGTPVWYSAYNTMTTSTSFQGNLQQYANGQAIGAVYVAPIASNSNVGTVQIQFTSPTTATLTLPNGTAVPVSRFGF